MTKTLTFFISIFFLICSCSNPTTIKENSAQNNPANDKADIAKLNDALKKYEEPSQIFKVSADKPSVVTGRKGTKISINPNDLVTESGKPLGENIDVELKELTNQGELLRANTQTISDGKLIVSGGAYFVGLTSNSEQLKLKDGRTLSVQFPKLTEKEMALFYGQRNDLEQINWQMANETFKSKPQQSKPETDTVITVKKESKSDIDAILDYIEGDTTTEEGKKEVRQWKAEAKVEKQMYEAIELAKLGWINCDRFLEVENKTTLYVNFNPNDSVRNANVYIIFKDINSVAQFYYYSDQLPKFEDMPVGYKARLFAYTVKDEKVFASSTDLTISKGQNLTMDLKETSDQDFKKLIGK